MQKKTFEGKIEKGNKKAALEENKKRKYTFQINLRKQVMIITSEQLIPVLVFLWFNCNIELSRDLNFEYCKIINF